MPPPSTKFDPYYDWLHVPRGPRPPDYYALLGLERFWGEQEHIQAAARHQISRIERRLQNAGLERQALCQILMHEVTKARDTLADPKLRRAYDAALKKKASTAPVATPAPSRARRRWPWLILAGGALCAAMFALPFLFLRGPSHQPQVAGTNPAPENLPALADTAPTPQNASGPAVPDTAPARPAGRGAVPPAPQITLATPAPIPRLAGDPPDPRPYLKAAAESARGTSASSLRPLLAIATAQVEAGDLAGASATFDILHSLDNGSKLGPAEQADIVSVATRAGNTALAQEYYKALLPQVDLPNPNLDPLPVAVAAAFQDDTKIADAMIDRWFAAPRTTTGTHAFFYNAMTPFNLRAAGLLRQHDRAGALRVWTAFLAAAEKSSVAKISYLASANTNSPTNSGYLAGPDFQQFLPIPVQVAIDQVGAGEFSQAAARLYKSPADLPGSAVAEYLLACRALAKLGRPDDLVKFANALETTFGYSRTNSEAPLTASCRNLLDFGDVEHAAQALAATRAPVLDRTTEVIRLAEALAAGGRMGNARDLLAQQMDQINQIMPLTSTASARTAIASAQVRIGDAAGARASLAALRGFPLPSQTFAWARLGEPDQANAIRGTATIGNSALYPHLAPELGILVYQAQDENMARAVLQRLDAQPDPNTQVYVDLCLLLARTGDFANARKYGDKITTASMKSTFANGLVAAAVDTGNIEAATDLWSHAGIGDAAFNSRYYLNGYGLIRQASPIESNLQPATVFPDSLLRRAWESEILDGPPKATDTEFQRLTYFLDKCDAALAVAAAAAPAARRLMDMETSVMVAGAPCAANLRLGARDLSIVLLVDKDATISLDLGNLILASSSGRPPGLPATTACPAFVNRVAWFPIWKPLAAPATQARSLPVNISAVLTGWTLRSAEFLDPAVSSTALTSQVSPADARAFSITVKNANPAPQWIRVHITNSVRARYFTT